EVEDHTPSRYLRQRGAYGRGAAGGDAREHRDGEGRRSDHCEGSNRHELSLRWMVVRYQVGCPDVARSLRAVGPPGLARPVPWFIPRVTASPLPGQLRKPTRSRGYLRTRNRRMV